MLDLRSEEDKRDAGQNKFTFKQEIDAWQEKPYIISCEEVETPKQGWTSSIHKLEDTSQIAYISASMERDRISFSFFTSHAPFVLSQRVFLDADHFECAMMITDLRRAKEGGACYAVMFTKNINAVPCKLVKFTQSPVQTSHEEKWCSKPETKVISHPD